jgi:hypothetical protein
MEIFVGNLSFSAAKDDLKQLFENFGDVSSAVIVTEKNTDKSRGFGFVTMPDNQQALAAIASLNGKEFIDRPLNVAKAQSKPKAPRASVKKDAFLSWSAPIENISRPAPEPRRIKFSRDSALVKKDEQWDTSRRRRNSWNGRGPSGAGGSANAPVHKSSGRPKQGHKKDGQRDSWGKDKGKSQPWKKFTAASTPWKKTGGGFKPWRKKEESTEPWKKFAPAEPRKKSGGGFKPWEKDEQGIRPRKKFDADPALWKKSGDGSRPWVKDREETRPWKKAGHKTRPWEKPAEKQGFGQRGKGKPRTWDKTSTRPPKPFAKGYKKSGRNKPKY